MAGVLILCGTPIGNLGDAPPRLTQALSEADWIYAEDTRRCGKLLVALGVEQSRLRSFFAGNEERRTEELAGRLAGGNIVALVTDAGTPGISDPGLSAVRAAQAMGAQVTIVPGPSAVTAALAVSGLGADRFSFHGYLPRSGLKRKRRIESLVLSPHTVVVFSAPHHLLSDLTDLAASGMADRPLAVVRELTKRHEEIWTGLIFQALTEWEERAPRGEFTLVIGASEKDRPPPDAQTMERAADGVRRLANEGLSTSAAVKEVARLLSVSRRDLYRFVHHHTEGPP